MLPLDAAELYDLSEAARLLYAGPGRIERWIRLGRVPATRRATGWHLPRPWVDAACGRQATDEEAVRRYWLERLAPASREAGRPLRDRTHLEVEGLRTSAETARHVFADEARLHRLSADGTLPALKIDGEMRYDGTLVDLVALADPAKDAAAKTESRRALVLDWTRYEYATDLDQGAAPPPLETKPAPMATTAVAPHAWRMPDGLAEDLGDLPQLPAEVVPAAEEVETEDVAAPADADADAADRSRLIQADGFETVDED